MDFRGTPRCLCSPQPVEPVEEKEGVAPRRCIRSRRERMARWLSAEGGGATSETGRVACRERATDVGGRVAIAVAACALPLLDSSCKVFCVALEAAGVNL